MSRLESFIRRMQAQRACIDFAARRGNLPQGPVFELGLGNGRTYDHLRERFGAREIFVFERRVSAHPGCVPDDDHLFLGEIGETLPRAARRFRGRVAFIHADISSGDEALDRATVRMLAPLLAEAAAPGALVSSDQPLAIDGWPAVRPDLGIAEDRYFLYRKPEAWQRRSLSSRIPATIPVLGSRENFSMREPGITEPRSTAASRWSG